MLKPWSTWPVPMPLATKLNRAYLENSVSAFVYCKIHKST